MLTMVLLKVDEMWATPVWMFFRTFFLVCLRGFAIG
jgi:hypothetical protein